MPKKINTFVNNFLFFLEEASKLLPLPFETPYEWTKRQRGFNNKGYASMLSNLGKQGTIKVFSKNGEKFLQLTNKGQLEVLLAKAALVDQDKWDGKWRLFMFDIPEDHRDKRDKLRRLLKRNNFIKLQASVFISPYALNKQAVEYLKETGLDEYIRILRVDAIDKDEDLKKKFKL
jgi:phenylacetic acid degradation operon negative regulatory protein